MSAAADANTIVGINWGSSSCRAYLIDRGGRLIDAYESTAGVTALDRAGMAAIADGIDARWPGEQPTYASGMIGSTVGWVEAPYAEAPAGSEDIARRIVSAQIGGMTVSIIPGVTCRRVLDGVPDVMRGEEVELLGMIALKGDDGLVALPGTHTKWATVRGGRLVDFFTSMSGEIFDRLTAQGLLASIVEGGAQPGSAFVDGVNAGRARRLGLGTLLFGARALVVRGMLPKHDAPAYLRGLLIGSEIADALSVYPHLAGCTVPLIGNAGLSRLYAAALAAIDVDSVIVDSREACLQGFLAIDEARRG